MYIFELFKSQTRPGDSQSVVTWTAIIKTYGMHGNATEALKLFAAMQVQKSNQMQKHLHAYLMDVVMKDWWTKLGTSFA